jgi:hypothetical protein
MTTLLTSIDSTAPLAGSTGSSAGAGNVELDHLISAYASPIPTQILTDYDNKARKKHMRGHKDNESALEHLELRGPVFREFTIHIF